MTLSEPTTQQLLDNLDVVAFYEAHIPAFKVNGHLNVKVDCPLGCGGGKSFSVERERGLYLCHRCGAKGSPWGFLEQKGYDSIRIRAALMEFQLGGTASDPSSTAKAKRKKDDPGPIVKTYDYLDENGAVLFQVTRHQPKDFRQRHKGPDGKWINNIVGVRRVLYGLPGLIEAVKAGWTIYVVEGEKDTDAINGIDSGGEFYATTAPMGAKTKWLPEYTPFLAGAEVVIVADGDEPGRRRALDVRHHLRPVTRSVRIVLSKAGKDASDHLAAGYGLAEFLPMDEPASGVEASTLAPTSFCNIANPDLLAVPWLIEGLIPAAGLTIVAAHYKTGKTFLMYRLVLDALFGRLALGVFPVPRPLRVQLWQFEMPLDVNLRRFHKLARGMSIDPQRIYQAELDGQFQAFIQPDLSLTESSDLAIFHERVSVFAPDLLIVDSLSEAFTDADFNNTRDVRKMLRAAFRPVTVAGRGTVALHHKRKHPSSGKDDDGKGSILGSQAFGAAARTVYTLDRVRDDQPQKGRFVVTLSPQGGWDLETTGSTFVIADDPSGQLTTVDAVNPKRWGTPKTVTPRLQAAIQFAQLVISQRRVGRQSAIEAVRLALKCGKTVAEDGLALAVERKWVELVKIEGTKNNEKEIRPGVNTDWDDPS